jgi:hypothetical protein
MFTQDEAGESIRAAVKAGESASRKYEHDPLSVACNTALI